MRTDFPKTVSTAILLAFVGMTSLASSPANAAAKNKAAPAKTTVTTSAKRKEAKAVTTTTVGKVSITAATTSAAANSMRTFKAEVWADNWFVLYNGESKVGEDSAPITTERSFNAEIFTFQARYPLQLRA